MDRFIFITIMLAATAAGATTGQVYYQDLPATRGYYWYDDPAVKEEVEPEEEPPAQPEEQKPEEKANIQPAEPKKPRIPDMKDYTVEQLWNMHPDEFQALLMDFQKKAVMTPSVEFVRDYKYMEDMARRKSLTFANVASYVMQTDAGLSIEKDFPTTTPGRGAISESRLEDVDQKLAAVKDRFALLFFTTSACRQCEAQRPMLNSFKAKTGWDVKEISYDQNPELFASFNVKTTPTMMLVNRESKKPIPLLHGVASYEDLQGKAYRTVRISLGETTPESFSTYEHQKGGAFDPTALPEKDVTLPR